VSLDCITLRVPRAAKALDVSTATLWNRINANQIAHFRDNGITSVVYDWPGEPPPREGRAPSIREYINEKLIEAATKRLMPEGVHKGRPRVRPLAAGR
jgi:hypothetical protein